MFLSFVYILRPYPSRNRIIDSVEVFLLLHFTTLYIYQWMLPDYVWMLHKYIVPVLNVHWDNLQVLMSERGKAKTLKLYENALYKYLLIIINKKYVYIMYIYLSNERHDINITHPFLPDSKPLINIGKHVLYICWFDMLFTSWFTNYNNNSWVTMFSRFLLLLNCKYYYSTNYD